MIQIKNPRSRAIASRGMLVYLMTILTKIDIFRFMSQIINRILL